jgi:hypothetical protein
MSFLLILLRTVSVMQVLQSPAKSELGCRLSISRHQLNMASLSRPGLLLTAPAPPHQTAQPPLVAPAVGGKKHPFNIMQHWGHLSPWYSVDSHGLPETDSLEPKGCRIKGMHWLQRHGAR